MTTSGNHVEGYIGILLGIYYVFTLYKECLMTVIPKLHFATGLFLEILEHVSPHFNYFFHRIYYLCAHLFSSINPFDPAQPHAA
jgi:hypothetical protein